MVEDMRDVNKPRPAASKTRSSTETSRSRRADNALSPLNVVLRKVATNRRPQSTVLAAFDPDHAVIWANEEFLREVERNEGARHPLRDENVEVLALEFARVLEYRDLFEDYETHVERITAIRKRRSRIVMRSTVESYKNRSLAREREAEETVQKIHMEILSSFDRAQRGPGLSARDIEDRAEQSAADMVRQRKAEFVVRAQTDFERIHDRGAKSGLMDDRDFPATMPHRILSLKQLEWLFPIRQSATLAELVAEVTTFDIKIVVPLSAPPARH